MKSRGQCKVDNAIIMAAGMSSRFAPLSYEKPKALLPVKGEILIERQIRQLRSAGVEEIVVVVGYLKEQFEYLKEKYQVILVENPYYAVRNNHSTLYVAKEYLKNTYICSGDNYFSENVFHSYEEDSFYSTVFEEGTTDEWCVRTDEEGRITDVEIGGSGEWVMRGHAFLSDTFSKQMLPYLENAVKEEQMRDFFWEDLFIAHISEMKMYRREYAKDMIREFDSLEELREFDECYKNSTGSFIMRQISRELDCEEKDIKRIQPLKKDDSTIGIRFLYDGALYDYCYADKGLRKE